MLSCYTMYYFAFSRDQTRHPTEHQGPPPPIATSSIIASLVPYLCLILRSKALKSGSWCSWCSWTLLWHEALSSKAWKSGVAQESRQDEAWQITVTQTRQRYTQWHFQWLIFDTFLTLSQPRNPPQCEVQAWQRCSSHPPSSSVDRCTRIFIKMDPHIWKHKVQLSTNLEHIYNIYIYIWGTV